MTSTEVLRGEPLDILILRDTGSVVIPDIVSIKDILTDTTTE